MFDDESDSCWFAAQLKPNGFKSAQVNLARQKFQTLMPSLQVTRRQGGRMLHKFEPLFPGYMFVKAETGSAPWQKINSTLGVSKLILGLNGRPAIIPPEFIEKLHARMDDQGQIIAPQTIPVGTKVQITSGPFAEWFAEVEACEKGERVNLLLSFMGRVVRTNLSLNEVKTA